VGSDERGDADRSALGLPLPIRACLFDLDGVLTSTAEIHMAAWKQTFDAFLAAYGARVGHSYSPFDEVADYETYVDGKPREDGTRSFLASRDISLPDGQPDDGLDAETVLGIGNAKNQAFQRLVETKGLSAFRGSVDYVHAVRAAGLSCAVVTSSANSAVVLKAAGIAGLFDAVIDGNDLRTRGLRGKPAPDTFLAAAEALSVRPPQAAVFEDALAGVAAGRAGGFGLVVGVDRLGQAEALREHGADVVVRDLSDLRSAS
jgi:beta-phosphoglucomutase family hydrolase